MDAALARDLAGSEGLWARCSGTSMAPAVARGERVRVKRAERVRAGDVVLLETGAGAGFLLHRVIFRLPLAPYFVHAGDRAGARPGIVHVARIIGTAETPWRKVRRREMLAGARQVAAAAARRAGRALARLKPAETRARSGGHD